MAPYSESENRYRIASLHTAGKILKAIAEAREPQGSADIAKRLDIPVNMAFRMIETMTEMGWLAKINDKYELGMGLALFWARKRAQLETVVARGRESIDFLGASPHQVIMDAIGELSKVAVQLKETGR